MQSKLREVRTRAGLAWDSSLLAADLGTSTTLSDRPARTAPPDPSCWFCVLGDFCSTISNPGSTSPSWSRALCTDSSSLRLPQSSVPLAYFPSDCGIQDQPKIKDPKFTTPFSGPQVCLSDSQAKTFLLTKMKT